MEPCVLLGFEDALVLVLCHVAGSFRNYVKYTTHSNPCPEMRLQVELSENVPPYFSTVAVIADSTSDKCSLQDLPHDVILVIGLSKRDSSSVQTSRWRMLHDPQIQAVPGLKSLSPMGSNSLQVLQVD